MKIEWNLSEFEKFAENLSHYEHFEREMERATKEIAHQLLKLIKQHTPIGDTWMLMNGWNENSLVVTKLGDGFEVLLVNRTEYATWVNDGHKQRPGRFIPGYFAHGRFYYDPSKSGGMVLKKPFVKGRFFVEKGILDLENTPLVKSIIKKHLRIWWDSV